VLIHLTWFFAAITLMPQLPSWLKNPNDGDWSTSGAVFAGRFFHFEYEPVFVKLLFWLDLPSVLGCALIDMGLTPLFKVLNLGTHSKSYLDAALLLLAASCQWLMITSMVQKRLTNHS
jgi:hypothetical protein